MKTVIQTVKGTRDFYPEDMAVRTWLYEKVRDVSETFGYQEYEGPFLELLELYAAKSGEELVKEQSFVFPDRSGELIALRPELTPTLVRMVAQRQNQLVFPLRWWSFGPFWRYERPQKGRSREFFQWNIDLIGTATPEGDAEMVAIIAAFFQSVGLTPGDVAILINDRRLIDQELQALAVDPSRRTELFRLIDRRSKMSSSDWEALLTEWGLSSRQMDGLMVLLSNDTLWEKSVDLQRFFQSLEALGAADYIRFDPSVVRGLDYYTGVVFEAQDLSGEVQRSILGGGRYDNLMADVGGSPLPGVGFAMGDIVITLIMERAKRIPPLNVYPAQILVTVFDEEHLAESLKLASGIRKIGLKVACYPQFDKLAKQFRYADRIGIRLVIVVGPNEIANNVVTVKDLAARHQREIPRSEFYQAIQAILETQVPS